MSKRNDYLEVKFRHCAMDPDYIVDVLGISSRELIEAFEDRFQEYLEEEFYVEEDEETEDLE